MALSDGSSLAITVAQLPRPLPVASTSAVSPQPAQLLTARSSGAKLFLRIRVEDEGIGVPADKKQTLFRPFHQTQQMAGGTGLGLYSLANRVNALGGTYGVTDRADGKAGSCFWFTIPYLPDNSMQEITAEPVVEEFHRLERPLNVLIVDDTFTIVKLMSMLFKKHHHIVSTAENGVAAIEQVTLIDAAGSYPAFDVVLMDLQMPVMDGLESTRRIRAWEKSLGALHDSSYWSEGTPTDSKDVVHENNVFYRKSSMFKNRTNESSKGNNGHPKHQFIIVVSANSDSLVVSEAFSAGADVFAPKPMTWSIFEEIWFKLFNQSV